LKQLVHGLAVSWFYVARVSKYRRLSDKNFIGPVFINQPVVNTYYIGTQTKTLILGFFKCNLNYNNEYACLLLHAVFSAVMTDRRVVKYISVYFTSTI